MQEISYQWSGRSAERPNTSKSYAQSVWRLDDGRKIRATVNIDHIYPHQSSGSVDLWTGTNWSNVVAAAGEAHALGSEKHEAMHALITEALAIIGDAES